MKMGKVSETVLKRSVLNQIRTKRNEVVNGAGIGEDCAVFSFSEGVGTVSCIQESPVCTEAEFEQMVFREKEPPCTMERLIKRCANNLAAGGGEPVAVMLALLLPPESEETALRELMTEAERCCAELNIQIAGGQTRISGALRQPLASVTGYGKAPKTFYGAAKAAPGQDVIVSKWIGLEGTAILAKKYREKLLARYPAYLVEEAAGFHRYLSTVPEAATAVKSGVCAMHDASWGGIFGALWELAEAAGVGLTIDLKKLPLRQETVEVCECCGVNPYELLSGGCLVMTGSDGPGLVSALKEAGIPAVIVGRVTDSNDRILINEDEIRYMDRPKQDALYIIYSENSG